MNGSIIGEVSNGPNSLRTCFTTLVVTVIGMLSCTQSAHGFSDLARRTLRPIASFKREHAHEIGEPRTVDSKLSRERRAAIERELFVLGIDAGDLCTDPALVGSPALRTFNTFILPRAAKLEHARGEPLAPAALRAAHQVSFLIRQQRAKQADYLRNTDRAMNERQATGRSLQPLCLVLDNLRSAYNVGSILRTAETAGCSEVLCCGITPIPPHAKLAKTACGADTSVPTRHFASTLAAVEHIRARGFTLFGMETTSRSENYTAVKFPYKTALVLGNENTGVDTAVMSACDKLIEIPTYGLKNSLNVASAAPVVVFEVLRQWEGAPAK